MLSIEDAKKRAEKYLRFNIGTLPHLGPIKYSEERKIYITQIKISYPRPPTSSNGELEFDSPETVGEIKIDAISGEVSHTPIDVIECRVEEIRERDDSERHQRN